LVQEGVWSEGSPETAERLSRDIAEGREKGKMKKVDYKREVQSLIEKGYIPTKEGGTRTYETDFGETYITHEGGKGIVFLFRTVGKTFRAVGKKVTEEETKQESSPSEEIYFRNLINQNDFPEKEGETQVKEEGDGTCIITRTKKGITYESLLSGVNLFYDLQKKVVQPYKEVAASVSRPAKVKEVKAKAKAADLPPKFVQQLGYNGETEEVDSNMYCHKITCACGNVRYVKQADLFQVDRCKPCVRKQRRQKREQRVKKKRGKV